MNDRTLNLYHKLPTPLRSIVASIRGFELRSWRYTKETERLVEEALHRDYWSEGEWREWQEKRIALLLRRAIQDVPYYRDQWAERRRRGDRASPEYLENWPVLHKEDIRRQPKAFLADGCNVSKMFHEHTSGTTGTPLDIWFSRKTVCSWYSVFEARWRRWNGITWRDRWAILGGQLVAPVSQRRPPFWVWNTGLHQLYMSSYHLSDENISFYLDALVIHRIKYLWGYSSSLVALAEGALRRNREEIRPVVVLTNAEPLYEHQRELIAAAFQCPVRETYGMTEIVAAASECQNGRMHLWPEVGFTEILDREALAQDGISGDLVCTGLMNMDMPLIRYSVGDSASFPTSSGVCECGRSLPVLASLEGRTDDILWTADGRPVGRLDTVFKDRLPIREAQIIQEELDRVKVLFVPAEDYTEKVDESIVQRLQARMGPLRIVLVPVENIPRSANGKFRAVISHLTEEDRQRRQTRNVVRG